MTKVLCFVALALFASGYVDSAIVRLNDRGQGNAAVAFGNDVAYHKDIPGTVKHQYLHFWRMYHPRVDRALQKKFWESQQARSPVVFVLDVSYSMLEKGRWIQYECFDRLIRHAIKDGNSVAIVAFGGRCEVVQNLTKVEGKATRDRLTEMVDDLRFHVGSSIGCGLRMGAEVLESNGRLAKGGTIFLISVGGENREPYIKDELPNLVAKGVTVHTFSLDSRADKPFMDLAQKTGGRAYTLKEVMENLIF